MTKALNIFFSNKCQNKINYPILGARFAIKLCISIIIIPKKLFLIALEDIILQMSKIFYILIYENQRQEYI